MRRKKGSPRLMATNDRYSEQTGSKNSAYPVNCYHRLPNGVDIKEIGQKNQDHDDNSPDILATLGR